MKSRITFLSCLLFLTIFLSSPTVATADIISPGESVTYQLNDFLLLATGAATSLRLVSGFAGLGLVVSQKKAFHAS